MSMSLSSYAAMNVQSLQRTLSMFTLDKAMNMDATSMDSLLGNFAEANPVQSVSTGSSGSIIDVRA